MSTVGRRWMTAEHHDLQALATDFFLSEAAPRQAAWVNQGHIDRDFWISAGKLGLLCCGVPGASHGAANATVAHDFVVLEAMVRAGLTPAALQVHSLVVPHYVAAYGTPEQRRRWLPELTSGQAIGALAMTEPDTGSDVQAIRTRARRTESGYRIDGAKTFITNGSVADLVIVAASTQPEDRGRGLSLFLLDTKDLAGFAVTRVLNKIGQHESDTAELFFNDVRVPASALLGTEGDGWGMLMEQLPRERLAVGVTAVAAMRRALSLATQYANERTSFGQRLIQHQHVRFELAECATLVHIAETFLDDCIVKLLGGDLDTTTVSMAKLWLTDTECQVVDRCLQIFGGYGYITEYPIADLYRNARAQRIYGGTNEIMKEVIGRSLITRDSRSPR